MREPARCPPISVAADPRYVRPMPRSARRRTRLHTLSLALALVVVGAAAPAADAPAAAALAPAASLAPAAASGTLAGLVVAPRVATKAKKRTLYVDKDTQAAPARKAALRSGQKSVARKLKVISGTAQAKWFGTWNAPSSVRKDVRSYVRKAKKATAVPQIVLYAIPNRDCGGYSAGGFSAGTYKKWVRGVAAGLKGSKALVVLEPDALGLDCGGSQRNALLRYAVGKLSAAGALVYIDAGHSSWRTPADMAKRLKAAGVSRARGFATNVSNFRPTTAERSYAEKVSKALGKRGIKAKNRHYVIDTSRNGRATAGAEWCNPGGQGLGVKPRWVGGKRLDAYLWVKRPGESDGSCNGGPGAGAWWTEYALGLVKRRAR